MGSKKRSLSRKRRGYGSDARPLRADALRNVDSLLGAAMVVFEASGVDAPIREIAHKAGVGVGTVYRHFPQRSDLIVAVLKTQIDSCADAAEDFAGKYRPGEHWRAGCSAMSISLPKTGVRRSPPFRGFRLQFSFHLFLQANGTGSRETAGCSHRSKGDTRRSSS